MGIAFRCSACGESIRADEESGGTSSQCPRCLKQHIVPTTLARANRIVDAISEVSASGRYLRHIPVSSIGASTPMEAYRALCIVTAEVIENAFLMKSKENDKIAREFIKSASGTGMWIALGFLPDADFELLDDPDQMTSPDISDPEMRKAEVIEQFASFAVSSDPLSKCYWDSIYQRLGLAYPTISAALPRRKPNWWQRLVGKY